MLLAKSFTVPKIAYDTQGQSRGSGNVGLLGASRGAGHGTEESEAESPSESSLGTVKFAIGTLWVGCRLGIQSLFCFGF